MRSLNAQLYAPLLLACALRPTAAARVSAAPAPPQAAAPSPVAGTYHYKTHRPGEEGYDNTLKVEDKGGGRLRVTLSGTYRKAGAAGAVVWAAAGPEPARVKLRQ